MSTVKTAWVLAWVAAAAMLMQLVPWPAEANVRPTQCTITGTARAEVIRGTAGDDVICAGAGNDIVYAGAGNDIVYAGAGNDIVYAGAGDDVVRGEAGNDTLYGEGGNDALAGGTGTDIVAGGEGVNVCAPEVRARQCMLDGAPPTLSTITFTYDGVNVTATWKATDSHLVNVTAQVGNCPAVSGNVSTASCPAAAGSTVSATIQASDAVGNAVTGKGTYSTPTPTVDRSAPKVVAFPTLTGARVGVPRTMRWTVQDTSPVTATSLTAVAGTVAATSGPVELVSTQGQRTAWQQHLNFTNPGRYLVSITATDVHGNSATRLVGYITAR